MELVIERCCGPDVHKKTVAACVRVPGPNAHLWDYTYEGVAWRFLNNTWLRALRWQRLPAFHHVAQLLSCHLDGLFAHCHEKIPFGKVEAISGNIRAMLGRGRGYRGHEYLLLKVQKATAERSPSADRMNTEPITDSVGERKTPPGSVRRMPAFFEGPGPALRRGENEMIVDVGSNVRDNQPINGKRSAAVGRSA
jgi:transposase